MGASPELFREVDGSRIAAVSVSSEALRPSRQPVRLNHSVVRLWRIAWAFDEQSRSKQRCDGHLLPSQRRRVVQL